MRNFTQLWRLRSVSWWQNPSLRLTQIDIGYINPNDHTARATFHTVNPVAIKNLVRTETFDPSASGTIEISVHCEPFRFIYIELT